MTPEIVPAYGNLENELPKRLEAMAMKAAHEFVFKNEGREAAVQEQYEVIPGWVPTMPSGRLHTRPDDAFLRLGFASIAYVRALGSTPEQSREDFAAAGLEFWNRAYAQYNGLRKSNQKYRMLTVPNLVRSTYEDVTDQTYYYLNVDERSPRWPSLMILGLIKLQTETQPWD